MLLAGRPFDSIEEHNAAIQDNINQDVGPKDTLVILGDVAFGSATRLAKWFDDLRCKNICLVYGNHDDTVKTLVKREPKRFRRVGDVLEFKIPYANAQVHVFCSHYAHRVWNKSHWGSYHVYGHSHGSLPDDPNARSMDVGVDTNRYRPWKLEDITERLDLRKFNPVDHHKDLTGLSGKTVCSLCNVTKDYHQEITLRCPLTGTTGAGIKYHETQYFAPKTDKPWLAGVLKDAKAAKEKWPDWAKSGS